MMTSITYAAQNIWPYLLEYCMVHIHLFIKMEFYHVAWNTPPQQKHARVLFIYLKSGHDTHTII